MNEQGSSSTVVDNRTAAGRHQADLFEVPLDLAYQGTTILDAPTIHWGRLYAVHPDAWDPQEIIETEFADARVRWMPAGVSPDPNGGLTDMLDHPCALISVDKGIAGSIERARDRGRNAARQAAALVMSRTRLIAGNTPIWEGPFAQIEGGRLGFVQVSRTLRVSQQTPDSIHAILAPFAGTHVLDPVEANVAMARYWYLRAWETVQLVDRFMNYWLAIAALYERHRPERGDRERQGIAAYVQDLATRKQQSAIVRDSIAQALISAYAIRNKLFHKGDFAEVDLIAVEKLEEAITRCIQLEAD